MKPGWLKSVVRLSALMTEDYLGERASRGIGPGSSRWCPRLAAISQAQESVHVDPWDAKVSRHAIEAAELPAALPRDAGTARLRRVLHCEVHCEVRQHGRPVQ